MQTHVINKITALITSVGEKTLMLWDFSNKSKVSSVLPGIQNIFVESFKWGIILTSGNGESSSGGIINS